jgi:hypothetical protein
LKVYLSIMVSVVYLRVCYEHSVLTEFIIFSLRKKSFPKDLMFYFFVETRMHYFDFTLLSSVFDVTEYF